MTFPNDNRLVLRVNLCRVVVLLYNRCHSYQDGREKRDTMREMYDKYEGWITVGGQLSKASPKQRVYRHVSVLL